jgi:hypothetical protein
VLEARQNSLQRLSFIKERMEQLMEDRRKEKRTSIIPGLAVED